MAGETITHPKSFKYRIYPSRVQMTRMNETLALCCELYNAGLRERRDAYRLEHKSISYLDQQNQLPEIKGIRPELNEVHSQVLQDVLRRLDLAFQAFFRRVKRGQKAGFPRFRSHNRYDSFTYAQSGFSLESGKLRLSKIGKVRIKLHRPVNGRIKTLTIKREAGRWYACFSAECDPKPLPACSEAVGIDVGLTAFATLSDGTEIDNPRWYRGAQKRVRRAQRKVARRKKGSHRRRKAVVVLQRIYAHIRNQRASFHHAVSHWLVNNYGLIAVEDLNIKGLAAGMLAKSVGDAGWGMFLDKIAYKAASAGRVFVRVNPVGTSQACLCGGEAPKTLKDRWHECPRCGLSAPRDHVSAQVILKRALGPSAHALTVEVVDSRRSMRSHAL